MAEQSLADSRLRLVLDDGIDEKGSPVYKRKSFNNVKTGATADQLFTIAAALKDLQERPLVDIERMDSSYVTGSAGDL